MPPSSGAKRQKLLSYRVLILIENQHVAALSACLSVRRWENLKR